MSVEKFTQRFSKLENSSPRIKNEFEIQSISWIVERTLSWFGNDRRLSKDFEIRAFYQENICIISNFATLFHEF